MNLRRATVLIAWGLIGMSFVLGGCAPEKEVSEAVDARLRAEEWLVLPSRVELGKQDAGGWADLRLAIMNRGAGPLTLSAVELDCSCAEKGLRVMDVDAQRMLTLPHVLRSGQAEAWRLRFRIPADRDRVHLRFRSSSAAEERVVEVTWELASSLQVRVGAGPVEFVDLGGFQSEEVELSVSAMLDSGYPFHVTSWKASHPGVRLEGVRRADAKQHSWVIRVSRRGLPMGLFSATIRVQLSGGGSSLLKLRGIVPPR